MKSDDVVGRVKAFESIVKGQSIPKPGIPESFKVLIKELQSLALDIKVLDKDQNEINLQQDLDDDVIPVNTEFDEKNILEDDDPDGYSITDENGEDIYDEDEEDDKFDDFFGQDDDNFGLDD